MTTLVLLVAFAAVGRLDHATEIAGILLCGGVAFSSHSAKSGARLFVNQSPEPFSNILRGNPSTP